MTPSLSYALVTPARDEATNLRRLVRCLDEQTLTPDEWIVVDDASIDGSAETAAELGQERPWMRSISSPAGNDREGLLRDGRRAGRDVVAFKAGVAALRARPDVLVKLDADVSFAPDYFERLITALEADPRLGIAGGKCYELEGDKWRPYHVTGGHVRGATRAYRWACFEDVSPLEERIGWDGLDEIRAKLSGWTTREISDLPFYHHRNLGARDGARQAWILQGELAHYMGYRVSYMVLRALFRARREPAALAMVGGYLSARRRRKPRCPDAAVRAYLRREQSVRNLPTRMRQARGLTGS
jgi:biofilm PGA synthesis N-glycosyltransferase PgaC